MTDRIVIVGANMAGGSAATSLRAQGFDGPIVVIGDEEHPPYERPPLSKEYLRGELTEPAYLQEPEWYVENAVELRLGSRATGIDTGERVVHLDDGSTVPFGQLLIATGGRNRQMNAPGRDLEGVFDLRTLEDSARIREAAAGASRVAIVGAGFMGSEVAASLRSKGLQVDVVEVFEAPLVRVLGPDVAHVIEAIHRDHGVRFHFGEGVERFEGGSRVERIVTTGGTAFDCDFAVVGVGIEPNVEVADGTGIAIDNGILVDDQCRTSVDGIFAAGDVANHDHPVFGRHLRVEHFDNALKQGAAAAKNMLGGDVHFDDPHWFWSDQYDANIQYAGFAPEWDAFVVRGSLEERRFVGFYLMDGIVRAVVGIDRGRDVRRALALVKARAMPEPAELRDEHVDLKDLAARLVQAGSVAPAGHHA